MNAITQTQFEFPNQQGFYKGKVRDVYYLADKMVMVVTDRISAFDVVLPKGIPYKGQVLNQITAQFLEQTQDIVPNWLEKIPHPNLSIGIKAEPIPIEMVVRGYLSGHAWREYKAGKRLLCGVPLPEGLKESDRLPTPIITPSTKAHEGHDEDISEKEILEKGIVSHEDWTELKKYALALFERGTEIAAKQGLILVDTKYEFGKYEGKIYLIDEVHTPDSSRYFYAEGYAQRQAQNEAQKQLSKEFVRQWLIENGFQGKEGQKIPEMTEDFVQSVSERYIELYERITGKKFEKKPYENMLEQIQKAVVGNI